jgi:hypothetical protein
MQKELEMNDGAVPPEYPDDADGDALRRVAGDGSRMSDPMLVDVFVAFPNRVAAYAFASAASAAEYAVKIEMEEQGLETCYCSRFMVLSYSSIVGMQLELSELAMKFGGQVDGWGTQGNA